MRHATPLLSCVGLAVLVPGWVPGWPVAPARAQEPVHLIVRDHHFVPDHIDVPAGQRFLISLTNQDDTTDEFESYDLKFEKIVVPGGTITVHAGPLHPGTYKFFDDYHPDQATGTVTATQGP